MVRRENLGWEAALRVVATNPAARLRLAGKGQVRVGMDADALLLDEDDRIVHLIANGALMIQDGIMLKKGTFED